MHKLTLEEMWDFAESKNGKCLSTSYTGMNHKLEWECVVGHRWKAVPNNIIHSNQWCPLCDQLSKRSTIEEMQVLAASFGGSCLSPIYTPRTKLIWKCQHGHVFKAKPSQIKNKHWCPTCAGNLPHTIEEMKNLAITKGGQCLSSTYLNSKSKLLWICSEGHQWEMLPYNALRGIWCPYCSGNQKTAKEKLEEMRHLALAKGGQCLSENYINSITNLLWVCSNGHKWYATPSNIKDKNSWCPYCKEKRSEKTCRHLFETFFHVSFPKSRPSWLYNSKGNSMELDGYSEKIKVAFEYQGIQHYEWCLWIQKTLIDFENQQRRDQEKRDLCKANGVTLIEIPWHVKDLSTFIQEKITTLSLIYDNTMFRKTTKKCGIGAALLLIYGGNNVN